MPKHITETTILICDKGAIPTPLSVTSQTFMQIEGKLQATEEDKKPNVNIKPFGVCSITHSSCVPAPIKWQDTSVFEIDGKKELLDTSTCQCSAGGKISVVKSAQSFSEEGGKSIYQPIVYDYNKEDEDDGTDEDFNDYQLLKDGTIKSIKDREKDIDRLFSSDKSGIVNKKNKIIVKKINPKSVSIIESLSKNYGLNRTGFPKGINFGRTNDDKDAGKLFVFVAKNSDVEWGLNAFNVEGKASYTIFTGHDSGHTPGDFVAQSMSKLLFEIHSHKNNDYPTLPVSMRSDDEWGDYDVLNHTDSHFKAGKYPKHYMLFAGNDKECHLWQYDYTKQSGPIKFYPGNRSKINTPQVITDTIDLKSLR